MTVTGCQTELMLNDLVGHPDIEVRDERGWGIIDLKTSKAISPKHWTQVCQYALMKQVSQQLDPPAFVGILRLDKRTGQYEYVELTDPDELGYEHAVFAAYHLAYQHGEKVRERTRRALEQEVLG